MSLLMEALRKAEEAKSKAAKETTPPETEPQDTASADDPFADLVDPDSDVLAALAETSEDEDNGPLLINPDPDEEELLAAHASDPTLAEPDGDDHRMGAGEAANADEHEDYEQVEFTTTGASDDPDLAAEESPATTENTADEDSSEASPSDYFSKDDGLSLLQSSYFSRTQNSGPSSLEDEFPDTDEESEADSDSLQETVQAHDAHADAAASITEAPVARVPRAATASRPDETGNAFPAEDAAKSTADSQASERLRRDSASALFLAKEDTRKRRLKKLVSVAAIVLLFPLAGIVYWLFTSLNNSSGMQFNVQNNGNLANRSFSDFQANVTPETADPQLGGTVADAGTVANTDTNTTDASDDRMVELAGLGNTSSGAGTTAATEPTSQELPGNSNNVLPTDLAPASTATSTPAPAAEPVPVPTRTVATQQAPAQAAPTTVQTPVAPAPQTAAPAATASNTATNTAPANNNALTFARTTPAPAINPDLSAAFDSYQAGDYAVAARLYQQVLSNEPNNRDALLHLATVYTKQNNAAMAQGLYVRLLSLNPRDPLARAGLLETIQGDPVRQENELKSLIAAYPGTAQLSFALGNLYATQRRWSEAQSAYFDALLAAKSNNSGPVSPDYAFNLAVSLERINQLSAALDYYREARTQSAFAAPGFDPAVLEQRLGALEARLR